MSAIDRRLDGLIGERMVGTEPASVEMRRVRAELESAYEEWHEAGTAYR